MKYKILVLTTVLLSFANTSAYAKDCLLEFQMAEKEAAIGKLRGYYDCNQGGSNEIGVNVGLCDQEVEAIYNQAVANAANTYDACSNP